MPLHLTDEQVKDLDRCDCGALVRTSSQEQLRDHVGHRLRAAGEVHLIEYIRIKLGLL